MHQYADLFEGLAKLYRNGKGLAAKMKDAWKAVNDEQGNINFMPPGQGWDIDKVCKCAAGEINKLLGKYRMVVEQERFLTAVQNNASGVVHDDSCRV